jgi:hypothetical protein
MMKYDKNNNKYLFHSDEDITPSHTHTHNDPLLDIQGPITRARVRQLNLEVSSFLSNSLYDLENRLLPNDYIVLRNEGEVQETHGGGIGGPARVPE